MDDSSGPKRRAIPDQAIAEDLTAHASVSQVLYSIINLNLSWASGLSIALRTQSLATQPWPLYDIGLVFLSSAFCSGISGIRTGPANFERRYGGEAFNYRDSTATSRRRNLEPL